MPNEIDSKSKVPDSNKQKKDILDIMKELQPVAFLLSMCLVIAAFYANPTNEVAENNLIHILMASLFFFFAYVGLFYYKKTDFTPFLYFGECSLIGGAWFVINAFSGIIGIIDKEVNPINGFFTTVFVTSFFLITSIYLSGKVKRGKIYNFSKVLFHLSLVLFFPYLVSFVCIYIIYYLRELQTGLYVSILLLVAVIVRLLFLITSLASLLLIMVLYIWEYLIPWELSLPAKFKNTNTFGMNIIESLGMIVKSLGRITYLMIGFCLIAIGFWLLVGS